MSRMQWSKVGVGVADMLGPDCVSIPPFYLQAYPCICFSLSCQWSDSVSSTSPAVRPGVLAISTPVIFCMQFAKFTSPTLPAHGQLQAGLCGTALYLWSHLSQHTLSSGKYSSTLVDLGQSSSGHQSMTTPSRPVSWCRTRLPKNNLFAFIGWRLCRFALLVTIGWRLCSLNRNSCTNEY